MALSLEFDPSKRGPFIPEARSSSLRSLGEIFIKDPSLSQANSMGTVSKIEITPEEAALYKTLRDSSSNGPGALKSDQALMAENVLTGEKSAQFKKAYPHIFPPIH